MHRAWPKVKNKIDTHTGPVAVALIADQAAPPENAYRTKFMGRETLFYWGPERFTKKMGAAFYFGAPIRLASGKFEMKLTRLATAEEAANSAEGELTEKFVRALEAAITQYPDQWIWSHRKWR
jgi:KDO2-lipid IV(A) lauroyltransferase